MLLSTLAKWLSGLPPLASSSNTMDQVPFVLPTRYPWIRNFASIGDSYAAGLGAGTRLDWLCSRYSNSYPNMLHTETLGPNPNRTHTFLACSGATSTEILANQVPALPSNLDLLTISAGGNDIGLTPILSACIYQFYMATEDACNQAIDQARERIANQTELYRNTSLLLAAASQKMNPDHGLIYYTGYATFFGTEDPACDNVTWAVWKDVEWQKQYLTRDLRTKLNDMVGAVNSILAKAVADAGPRVRFIDYDDLIRAFGARYCELNVKEPAPNRSGLVFYEWGTVDRGENSTAVLNSTGDVVPERSFEAGIARDVERTLERHPEWEVDENKGFLEKNDTVGQEGWLGNGVHWLLPDSYKRVFHLRPDGHELIARRIYDDLRFWDVDSEKAVQEL